ncbi:MAG: DUF4835 family protein [Flavobacteriales bacterium]
MLRSFSLLLCFLLCLRAVPQELKCAVQVVSEQVSDLDKTVVDALKSSIFEFVNNRKWTSDKFSNDERIECSIMINITQRISTDEFKGTIQVQSRRPVYHSSYNTTIINHIDNDFQFRYVPYQPLDFSESSHLDNLTSVLGFYVYLIIGLDYETYSLYGGTTYLLKASTVVNNAQSAKEKGWKAYEGTNNRYWMIENYLNDAQFKPLRECMYKYHRLGFDMLADKVEQGRSEALEALELLKKTHRNKPNSFNVKMFFNAKADEIVNLFSQSFPQEKTRVINLLSEVDPANTNKYSKIRSNN